MRSPGDMSGDSLSNTVACLRHGRRSAFWLTRALRLSASVTLWSLSQSLVATPFPSPHPPPALRGRNAPAICGGGTGYREGGCASGGLDSPIGKLCDGLATLRLAQKPFLARHRDQQPPPAHRPTPLNCPQRGRSSAGRAPPLHGGGQGFESPRLHQPLHADSVGASAPTWYHSSGLVIRARWPHPFPSRTRQ